MNFRRSLFQGLAGPAGSAARCSGWLVISGLAVAAALDPEASTTPPSPTTLSERLVDGGRIDAVAYLGDGVVLAGTRAPNPGHVFRSEDRGATWTDLGSITGTEEIDSCISCLAAGAEGTAYLLTGNASVWKSDDYGKTWAKLGRISKYPRSAGLQAYGLTVLDTGTVLISDTDPGGGHVFRSADGGATWDEVGRISSKPLYRFEKTADGVLVNGWDGRVFKSKDDGKSWQDMGRLTDAPLYATEYLGEGIALQAAENGRVFRSVDDGETWRQVADLKDAADDFAHLGAGLVVYSTYLGGKRVFVSEDFGETWTSIGPVATDADGDVLDHFVGLPGDDSSRLAVGGTKQGFIVRLRGTPFKPGAPPAREPAE